MSATIIGANFTGAAKLRQGNAPETRHHLVFSDAELKQLNAVLLLLQSRAGFAQPEISGVVDAIRIEFRNAEGAMFCAQKRSGMHGISYTLYGEAQKGTYIQIGRPYNDFDGFLAFFRERFSVELAMPDQAPRLPVPDAIAPAADTDVPRFGLRLVR